MKPKYTALALLLVLGTAAPLFVTYAETSARTEATTTRKAGIEAAVELKKENIKDARQNFIDVVKQKKDEIKSVFKNTKESVRIEFRADLAVKQVSNVTRVLTATANRLDGILARIESRIQKIKANGGSTITAESSVALAKTDLANARVQISTIGTLDLSGASTTAKTNFEKIKSTAQSIKTSLTSARKNLSDAVSSLKGSEKNLHPKNNQATTTVSASVSVQ